MDGTADAVVQLHVQLGQDIGVEDAGLRDVPDGCGLHDVPDDELLDGFVLGDAAGAVGAADGLDVAAALLGPTVVPPLLPLR